MEVISEKSGDSKAIWAQWDRLQITDEVLVRRYENVDNQTNCLQVVMPRALRRRFVEQIHEGFEGGHLGRTRTVALIRARAYWPGWREDVDLWLKCCKPCSQYFRGKPPHRVGLQPIKCGECFEIVSIDITG